MRQDDFTGFRIASAAWQANGWPLPPAPLIPALRERRHQTFSQPQTQVVLQGPETGTPVVLCHALGLDLSMWSGVARHLAARGHPVMRYDLQGHGASALEGKPDIEALVADAARLVQEWNMGPVVFVGLSLGGMVAQGLAIRHPQLVRALVLANTAASYPPAAREGFLARGAQVRAGGMASVVDAALQRYLSQEFQQQDPVATAALRERLQTCSADAYAACCEALAAVDWHAGLAGIRVPTWIVSGAADLAAPPALQQALKEGIAQARLTVLRCAHLPTLEAPEAFTAGLEAFIADHGPIGAGSSES